MAKLFDKVRTANRHGMKNTVKFAINTLIQSDERDHKHDGFLLLCEFGTYKDAKKLVSDLGLDISYKKNQPIRTAVKNNKYQLTRYLLKEGADPNTWNGILYKYAVQNGNAKLLSLLLKHGKDLDFETSESILCYAIDTDNKALIDFIVVYMDEKFVSDSYSEKVLDAVLNNDYVYFAKKYLILDTEITRWEMRRRIKDKIWIWRDFCDEIVEYLDQLDKNETTN